ncbi:MAG: tRNA (adenosine(37)-N6)-threonylcarbamoyltransferase complex dimerization subunit type 1 TsaB [Pseudomonadota bacterium]
MTPLLAFDTARAHCAACLLVGDQTIVRVDEMAKGQAEHLMPMLEEMLAEQSLAWADLKAIGVGTGPGNFTGIRISVAAARGLALGLKVPAVGVTHLEAQVHGLPRPVSAICPAPREQVYLQAFADDPGKIELVPDDSPHAVAAGAPLTADQLIRNIAKIAVSRAQDAPERPKPTYVRPADAAPPRDTAPVILD